MEEEKITPELEEASVENVNNQPEVENAQPEVEAQPKAEPEKKEKEESLADSVRIVSPGRLVAKRFFRSRLSMVGLVVLVVLFLFSFIGPIFSPWGEIDIDDVTPEEKKEIYTGGTYNVVLAPELIFEDGIVSETGALNEGVVYDKSLNVGSLVVDGDVIYFTLENGEVKVSDEIGHVKNFDNVTYKWERPFGNIKGKIDSSHWLGTDERGMDVFVRLMYGGRISLTLGFVVVILETMLGVIFGGLAGYFGKWVDQIIMRIVDIINCIPQFPILLILSAVLDGLEIDPQFKIYYLMAIMTVLGWSGIARVVRGQILFLREQEFMIAAEALGLSVPRKIFRHLLPNIMPQLLVQMTLGLGGIILTESTLSYLNIGIPAPYAAWGTMISSAQTPEILNNYPNLWIPAGAMIVLAVLAFNFVGDGLRDAFDPKASR